MGDGGTQLCLVTKSGHRHPLGVPLDKRIKLHFCIFSWPRQPVLVSYCGHHQIARDHFFAMVGKNENRSCHFRRICLISSSKALFLTLKTHNCLLDLFLYITGNPGNSKLKSQLPVALIGPFRCWEGGGVDIVTTGTFHEATTADLHFQKTQKKKVKVVQKFKKESSKKLAGRGCALLQLDSC